MKWKKLLSIFSHILTTLLFIALLLTLFLVISSKASGGDTNLFGYQLKTVLSGSMEPDIKTGSIISIKSGGDMTRFTIDDVITFRTEEEILVTHRIVQVLQEGQQYITKGDANDGADLNPVLFENIIGEYTGFTVPYIGYITNFANSNKGTALLLILPGILLIIYAFVIIWHAIRQVERTKSEVNTKSK